ncbi:unnamed protein product [Ectocarpus sp. 12 AP-2014]
MLCHFYFLKRSGRLAPLTLSFIIGDQRKALKRLPNDAKKTSASTRHGQTCHITPAITEFPRYFEGESTFEVHAVFPSTRVKRTCNKITKMCIEIVLTRHFSFPIRGLLLYIIPQSGSRGSVGAHQPGHRPPRRTRAATTMSYRRELQSGTKYRYTRE